MTRSLIIMRHAKSSWGDPGQSDFERPLNKRGRKSAAAIGQWLTFGNFHPDHILCSAAARTIETYECTGLSAQIDFDRGLYLADADRLLTAVRQATGRCVMLIAHNPGIAEFAERIVQTAPSHDRFYDYPTAATLVVEVAGTWDSLTWGSAALRAFTVPRDLI